MDVKKLVLLIGALVIAAVTAVMAKNMFTGASAPQAQAKPVKQGPQVLVATRSLPVGTIIDADALKFQAWPAGLVQPAYFIKGEAGADPQGLLGTVVRNEITAGQPLTQGALIKPGDRGFLAAALGPGMRAVTVPVSSTSGVAGFIFPGDRVDILLTQQVSGPGGPPLKVSETILRNMRVLAVDQRTASVDAQGKPQPAKKFNTVTLEATPKIAEMISVARMIGKLSFTLRSIADNNAELERAIASGAVKVPDGIDPAAEKRLLVQVAGKPTEGGNTFTVGGDVSRYQRTSVPFQPSATDIAKAMGIGTEPVGPTVRVARGNSVTTVPLGAK